MGCTTQLVKLIDLPALAKIVLVLVLAVPTYASDTARVFGRIPLFEQVQISPDGQRIAYMQEMDGKYVIVNKLMDSSKQPSGVYGLRKGRVRNFRWVGDSHLLVTMSIPYYSKGDYEWFTLWRVGLFNVQTNEMDAPFQGKKFSYNVGAPSLVNMLPNDPEHILMAHYDGGTNKVYRVRLSDGKRKHLETGYRAQNYWRVDADGNVILKRDSHPDSEYPVWFYRGPSEAKFVPLRINNDGESTLVSTFIFGISNTGGQVYYRRSDEQETDKIVRANIQQGSLVEPILVGDGGLFDVHNVLFDPHTSAVTGVIFVTDQAESKYFTNEMRQIQADLEATFPSGEVGIESYSVDKTRFVVTVSGGEYALKYFLYDRSTGSISELANPYPGVLREHLSKVERFEYVAQDELRIHSYLTLPQIGGDDLPPLIVMPHGGPTARDDKSFDWQRQFFASQGYAVFQPNFRGSSGYGDDFIEAGLEEWGGKMQSDIDDGVEALIREKLIDPNRICIVGSSYGGYAAMMGVVSRPDLYKCAVSYGGISDLGDMYNHSLEQNGTTNSWEKSIGSRFSRQELKNHSPLFLAKRETPPILLFHGDRDTVVPPEQSRQMNKRLKKLGNKGRKMIVFNGEDHWFSKSDSRLEFLLESHKFIIAAIGN